MFRLVTFLLLIMAVFMAATCERPLDLNLDEPPPSLVVISNFTNDQDVRVHVSKSRSILSNEPIEYLLNADVEIFKEDSFIEKLELVNGAGKSPPYYTTREMVPEVDVTYTVHVEAEGFEPVTAKSHIPKRIELTSFFVSDLVITDTPDGRIVYNYNVNISFVDPGEEKNYYHLNLYQQIHDVRNVEGETSIERTYFELVDFSSVDENNYVTAYFGGGILFEDDPFNGTTQNYIFPIEKEIQSGSQILGKVYVELRAVSADYYLYHNSLSRQQNNPDLPFNEPVIIYDNINNGKGIFAGYNSALDSLTVDD